MRPAALAATTVLLVSVAAGNQRPAVEPLTLETVLDSVERDYPLLLAAIQERAIADGNLLSAQGEFDLKAASKSDMNQFGFRKNRTIDSFLEQPTTLWGAKLFGGFRRGQGNFGPWEEDKLTLSDGEWRGGIDIPLFRDRAIDRRRANLRIAALQREIADASVERARLAVFKAAAQTYWEWVAAGHGLEIARALLDLASTRVDDLRQTVELGQTAPIELTDNQRAILQRRSQLVRAERAVQNAAIELSLFLRDAAGTPLTAELDRLPEFPDPSLLEPDRIRRDIERALRERPELRQLLGVRGQLSVEWDLARNDLLPTINFFGGYFKDFGTGSPTKVGAEFKAGLTFELPVQRRKARGKLAVQEAKLSQLDAEARFTADRVVADVRDAASALEAAYQGWSLARAEVEVSRELEEAERLRFDLGDSTLFVVNLRELATADAAFREVSALASYFKALADYRVASAQRP